MGIYGRCNKNHAPSEMTTYCIAKPLTSDDMCISLYDHRCLTNTFLSSICFKGHQEMQQPSICEILINF